MIGTVLVAGGTGFVGSHTLEALTAMGVRTVALVRDPARLPPGLADEVRCGDLRDKGFVADALEGVDAVCACAGWTSAWGHAEASRRYFLEPNLGLLDAALSRGVKRLVFPSSTTAGVLDALGARRGRRTADGIWPHMANVLRIEERMRELAGRGASMVVLRLGLFAGRRYGLGMLPILLPRLATHMVPWVGRGRTGLPLIAGEDVGRAMAMAASRDGLEGYTAMDVVSRETPTAREVLGFLHEAYGYPLPHFGVSFPIAYAFGRVMEALSGITPWHPFITRSLVLLLEETAASNAQARRLLGYEPRVHWRDAVRAQLAEMRRAGIKGLPMARPMPVPPAAEEAAR